MVVLVFFQKLCILFDHWGYLLGPWIRVGFGDPGKALLHLLVRIVGVELARPPVLLHHVFLLHGHVQLAARIYRLAESPPRRLLFDKAMAMAMYKEIIPSL